MRTLVQYRPRSYSLSEDLDRLFGSFFDEDFSLSCSHPRVDIREEEGRYILEAELPGLTEKDIDIKVDDNLLQISTKEDAKKEETKKGYLIRERRTSRYHRSFVLPSDVDREKVDASFVGGLLTLTIPKAESAKPRQIEVKKA